MIYATEQELRDALIHYTEYIVANEGMHRATTKNIAEKAGINEAYIYRTFKDKDDLVKSAFDENDIRLRDKVMENLHFLDEKDRAFEDRLRALLTPCLDLMLANKDHCLFYLRYYFSEKYLQLAKDDHDECFRPVYAALAPYFNSKENYAFVVNFVFESMLTFVYNVSTNEGADKEEAKTHIIDMLINLLMDYMQG